MRWYTHFCAKSVVAVASAAFLFGGSIGCSNGGVFGGDDDDGDRVDSEVDRDTRVPRNAAVVAEGENALRYRATDDGRVYLYDATDSVVLDARAIDEGREYIVAPDDGKAWIDQTRVLDHDFKDGHRHRIYFLAGTAVDDKEDGGNRAGGVPKSAEIVREGRGDLSFEATRDGTVYVYDVRGEDVVTSARVADGDRFTVSPESGEVTVDGRVVTRKTGLKTDKTYRLYFDRGT